MSNCNIKELFDENRYPSGWKAVFLLVYSPIGLLLAVLRVLIALQALLFAMLLPQIPVVKNFVLRSLCAALGIIVKQENEGARDESARLLVANHVSRCDHIAVHLTTGSVSTNAWEIPAAYSWALGMKDLGVHQGRDALVNNIRGHLEKCPSPVLCLPEGATTNGRVGLLKFVSWPFCLADAVQPVAVRVWRPSVAEVAPTALATSAWADIFWFLFVPCTVFTLKFLPVVKRENGEGEEVLAEKVAQLIAKELGIMKTQHTAADKAEYEKRWIAEQNHPLVVHTRTMNIGNLELQRMAQQVTEVLPNVPQETILRDLARTRNVDLTISNILEGVVAYIPVQVSPNTSQGPSSKSSSSNTTSCGTSSTNTTNTSSTSSALLPQPSTSSPQRTGGKPSVTSGACLDTSAPSFPRSAQERMLSFNERKARLIENARQRYIEKHGLKNVGLNC